MLSEVARGLTADQIIDLSDVLSRFIMGKPLLIIFKTVELVFQLIARSVRPAVSEQFGPVIFPG